MARRIWNLEKDPEDEGFWWKFFRPFVYLGIVFVFTASDFFSREGSSRKSPIQKR